MSVPTLVLSGTRSDRTFLRHLASVIKERWKNGEPPDAAKALEDYPVLNRVKAVQLELAFEEYRLRRQAGEQPDLDSFCRRFPSLKVSLRRLVEAHELRGESPTWLTETPLVWPEVGTCFLGFELLEELGRGAFARVYLARELALGHRLVALKVSPEGWAEADTLGRLQHPNIVPIYSVQHEPDGPLTAVCMPYRGRSTLCDVLDYLATLPRLPQKAEVLLEAIGGPGDCSETAGAPDPDFPIRGQSYVSAVLRLTAHLAEALDYAHQLGVYHRDLKPSNVLLTPGCWPLLLDFNLAFDTERASTSLGGTLPYMPPEQLQATESGGSPAAGGFGPQGDLFSLGVMLYELLTGQHPFGPLPSQVSLGELRQTILARQRQGPRPLRQFRSDADPRLERLLLRLLAFEPQDRPASGAEVARLLRQLAHRPQHKALGASVAVAACLLAALAAGIAGRFPWGEAPASAVAAPADGQPLVTYDQLILAGKRAYQDHRDKEAADAFAQAALLASSKEQRAQALFYRGRAVQRQAMTAHDLQLLDAAVSEYATALHYGAVSSARACLAYCLALMPQIPPAKKEEYLGQCLEQGEESAHTYNNLAWAISRDTERLAEALTYADKAVALKPDLPAARVNRAQILLRLCLLSDDLDPQEEEKDAVSFDWTEPKPALLRRADQDLQEALQLGATHWHVHYLAACVARLLSEAKPSWKGPARGHLASAVKAGWDPQKAWRDPLLGPLADWSLFSKDWFARELQQLGSACLADPLDGRLE
jgi:serine/threonine protein kinase